MGNNATKMKVLHVRTWTNRDGSEGKWWTEVGQAWMNEKGVDVTLQYLPLVPSQQDGAIRLVLRIDDGQPTAGAGGFQGQPGQGRGQPGRGAPGRPQGGFRGQGGPQHRDALQGAPQGGQGAQYGGAAGYQEAPPPNDQDDIPF